MKSGATATMISEADRARRYLRRRREVLLCILVSLLGVLVAWSIPVVDHEREVCACRTTLRAPVANAKLVARDVVPVDIVAAAAADLYAGDDGVAAVDERGAREVPADRCGDR